MNKIFKIVGLLVFTAACARHPAAPGSPTSAPAPLSKEQMEKSFQELSTPGAEHAVLKKLAGNWSTAVKFWYGPETKPEVTKGWSQNQIIFGGRYAQENFNGKANGKAFQGMSLTGYDKAAGQYVSIWADSMNTAMMKSTGSYDSATDTISWTGSETCPMVKEEREIRSYSRFQGKNKMTYEMFQVAPNGEQVKVLEVVYTRRGSAVKK